MTRAYCKQPGNCAAGVSGSCRVCQDTSVYAAIGYAVMKKLHADPAFAKAHAERCSARLRKLHADPEFARANAARSSERMRKRHVYPVFRQALQEHLRQWRLTQFLAIGLETQEEIEVYRIARRKRFSKAEAIRIATGSRPREAAE